MKQRLLPLLFLAAVATATATLNTAYASGEAVLMKEPFRPGTIVVRTKERALYYVTGAGQAIRYPVGVGRSGKQWAGNGYITGKYTNPSWVPPSDVRRDKPNLPRIIPGGSPHNPMGVATMTLSGGEYAIHGTNRPSSIGHFVSYGCIRMFNGDIQELYQRVSVGTPVIVQ
jgi:lipoprotein-anchoring transpeptidase ErfK/SrfK